MRVRSFFRKLSVKFAEHKWTFLFIVFVLLILIGLPRPHTFVSLNADTETVRYTPASEVTSSFVLTGAYLWVDDEDASWGEVQYECVDEPLLISLKPGAAVDLASVDGALSISIIGGMLAYTDDQSFFLDTADSVYIELGSEFCVSEGTSEFPIHGTVHVGEDFQAASSHDYNPRTLRSGELTIYGRAIASFWFLPLRFDPFEPGALYLVDQIELPANSQVLSSGVAANSSNSDWWGYATWEVGAPSLRVAIASNTEEIVIVNPALDFMGGSLDSAGDVISLSLAARLVGDPNLKYIYGFLALLALAVQLAQSIKTNSSKDSGDATDV